VRPLLEGLGVAGRAAVQLEGLEAPTWPPPGSCVALACPRCRRELLLTAADFRTLTANAERAAGEGGTARHFCAACAGSSVAVEIELARCRPVSEEIAARRADAFRLFRARRGCDVNTRAILLAGVRAARASVRQLEARAVRL